MTAQRSCSYATPVRGVALGFGSWQSTVATSSPAPSRPERPVDAAELRAESQSVVMVLDVKPAQREWRRGPFQSARDERHGADEAQRSQHAAGARIEVPVA